MHTLRFDQKVTLQEVIAENEHICVSFVEYLASIHAVEAFEFWVEVGMYSSHYLFSFSLLILSPHCHLTDLSRPL